MFNIGSQSKKEINYDYVGIHKVNDMDKISEQNLFFFINLPVYVNLKKWIFSCFPTLWASASRNMSVSEKMHKNTMRTKVNIHTFTSKKLVGLGIGFLSTTVHWSHPFHFLFYLPRGPSLSPSPLPLVFYIYYSMPWSYWMSPVVSCISAMHNMHI